MASVEWERGIPETERNSGVVYRLGEVLLEKEGAVGDEVVVSFRISPRPLLS